MPRLWAQGSIYRLEAPLTLFRIKGLDCFVTRVVGMASSYSEKKRTPYLEMDLHMQQYSEAESIIME